MKKSLSRVFVLVVALVAPVALFAAAVDFSDPTRPMFGADTSWWTAVLAMVGLG